MPNWIKNKLSFEGDEFLIESINDFISTFEESIDFEKILPIPDSLREDYNELGYDLAKYLDESDDTGLRKKFNYIKTKDQEKTFENYVKESMERVDFQKLYDNGKISIDNEKKWGYKNRNYWCIENWGTKWNAMQSYLENKKVVFETAWSNPFGVILELSNKYPTLLIKLEFADESIGENCGEYHLKNGEVVFQREYDEVEACILWGYDPKEMFDYVRRDCIIQEILNKDDNNNSSL